MLPLIPILGLTGYVLWKKAGTAMQGSGEVYGPPDPAGPMGPIDPFYAWDYLFQKYGSRSRVPWRWLKAICMVESNLGRAASVARGLASPKDTQGSQSFDGKSWGLMQFTLPTAGDYMPGATPADLNDPEISVMLAGKYVRHLMDLFGGDRRKVIMSYNQGEGNTQKGRDDSAYYSKFTTNLDRVLSRQPGNELE